MKKKASILAGALALLAVSCVQQNEPTWENPVLTVEGGQIQGVLADSADVLIYKGVPFAAAPVGELRWKKPQPVTPWDTIMLADHFRNASPQAAHDPNDGGYGTEFFTQDAPFSEDCLHVNIWTPKHAAGDTTKKLPVALWIHGGAYNAGWSFEPEMDGEAWAQRDVILVTANYRLGIFGFLNHPELSKEGDGHSGNYGTYDQVAALKWVYNNIEQFGGDPENITIFGQSAGGASIKNLVNSPLSKGMVKKAIIQSAGGVGRDMATPATQEELDASAEKQLSEAGFTTISQLRAASYEELMQAIPMRAMWGLGLMPHQDGVLLTQSFNDGCMTNTLADVPYMLGHCSNDIPGLTDGEQRFAEVRDSLSQQPVYIYYFDRPLPSDGRKSLEGAFHSSELWYTFHTLDRSWRPFTAADHELSNRMVDYWTNFCKFGNPNGAEGDAWAPYKKDAPFVKEFDVKK